MIELDGRKMPICEMPPSGEIVVTPGFGTFLAGAFLMR
jgi:hypothetical protein